MSYKRILLSLGTIAVVAGVAVGMTGAFFTDSEVSAGNTFAAGEVDVAITDIDHTDADGEPGPNFETTDNGMSFELDDLKPLDEGTIDYDIENNGNPAFVCATAEEVGNAENERLEQESDSGDTTAGDPGTGNGELQNFLSFRYNNATGTLSEVAGAFSGQPNEVSSGGTTNSEIEYCFGDFEGGDCVLSDEDDNVAQTDSVNVDLTFQAVQQRNNENFTCDALSDDGGVEERPTVGADLDSYEAPVTEDGADSVVNDNGGTDYDTIQAAVDEAEQGDTILVRNGTYDEEITVDVEDLTIAAKNQGDALVDGGFSVEASGVKVTGFEITSGSTQAPNNGNRYGIRMSGASATGQTASYNRITNIDDTADVKGIQVFNADNATIEHNVIDGVTTDNDTTNDFGGAKGIMVQADAQNTIVERNTIASVGDSGSFFAMGVNVTTGNTGGGPLTPNNTAINRNDIESVEGAQFPGVAIGIEQSDTDIDAQTNNLLTPEDVELKQDGIVVDAQNSYFGSDGVVVDNQSNGGTVDTTPNEGSAYPSN